ncbi:nuclease-related domain-containing protein [Methanoculleus sp. 7T]|uniref:nuclease-related domain-containing protein n=1 Tax=Methanoculleus sp. 7T TaxID=2937282 RepID=UPI0020BDDA17|nr:nuclease-related domain-containing protein [Methanoculleus sp. 7T]MCK8519272.1 NERD domain-containing protein [Methanoculleus sp. 7T]
MVIIHGVSGSTKYLLNGLKSVGGGSLGTFEDIHHFYNNYTGILAETEAAVNAQLDERIAGLGDAEVQFDAQIREGIARRTAEIDAEIAELKTKIANATNILTRWGYTVKCWIAVSLRSRSISRPSSGLKSELRGVQNERAMLIRKRPELVNKGCSNIIANHAFIADNLLFYIGAIGEETVIAALSRISDEYHLFNDVNLRFHPPIHWREMNDYIKSSQIDHIVVGPTGLFVVETKNWKFSDIEKKSDKLVYQVRRSSLALWYYLRKNYARNDVPKTRNVVVSVQGCRPGQKLDSHIDITTPNRLCEYITKRTNTLPADAVDRLVAVIGRIA